MFARPARREVLRALGATAGHLPQVAVGAADVGAMDLTQSLSDRWFGVGHSTVADAASAGTEAARNALAGREPTVVFVFSSVSYDLPVLLDAVRRQVGGQVTIVGGSSSGQITPDGVSTQSVAVVAWGGAGFTVRTGVARNVSGRLREAGTEVAACLAGVDRPHSALLLLCDGLTGSQHEIVRGAYTVAGAAVPLVGGCTGDDLTYRQTYQFHGDASGVEVMSDAVVGVAIGSDAPMGVGIAHGWSKQDAPMIVTSSAGFRVYELDDRPALDVYMERLNIDESVASDDEAFRRVAFLHPLGLSRRSGEDIRVIHGADLEDRSLLCLADVPQGALAWLMEADHDALVGGARQSCEEAIAKLGGAAPLGLLAFDCAARKLQLEDVGTKKELAAIANVVGDLPFGGFYTNGEIARVRGALGMHHLTLVTLALA